MTPSLDELSAARGAPVYTADNEKIGKVEEIYLDDQTQRPEWVGVSGGGVLSSKRFLVPVQGADLSDDGFRVPYAKEQVETTPDIDSDHIDQGTEHALYSHYGLGYSEAKSDSGLPEGSPDRGNADEGGRREVVRSEEELAVGKEATDTGTVRLRKWVETEPVSADVTLEKETARVEREPINQPVSEAEIGEAQVDVPLKSERAVVDKRTVAKERVSVDKDVTAEDETVSGEVRKEQVEVDGDNVRPA